MATAFLLSSDRRRYGELILSLNNEYTQQQKNYLKTLTDMNRLMGVFELTRPILLQSPILQTWVDRKSVV